MKKGVNKKRKKKPPLKPKKRPANKKPNKKTPKKPKRKPPKQLTVLERRFVRIYHGMRRPNKREAYELAGYQCRGETARTEAETTLRKPHVAAYLKKLQSQVELRAAKGADQIIAELENIGFSNIMDYIEIENGKIKLRSLTDLTREQSSAISEVCESKLKLHNKVRALKDLGLRFGIFPTKIEHTGEITLAQAVHKAMKDG